MSFIRSYLPETVNDYVMYYIGMGRCTVQGYINNTFSASEIRNNIFIGDLASASNKTSMKEQGITHVLSIYNGSYEMFPDDFKYKIIHINDDSWCDIKKHFGEAIEFISDAVKDQNNKVMVHCQRGVSRSVTLVMAYMLWEMNNRERIEQDSVEEVISSILSGIQEHRSIADPNDGFIEALKDYVYEINGYIREEADTTQNLAV